MPLTAVVEADRFELNGQSIREAQPIQILHGLLGPPDRVQPAGPPAPVGHRNNQIHFYDGLGLYLNEHHYTYLIEAITFVLWRDEAPFTTGNEFEGELRVGGVLVKAGITEREMQGTSIPFVEQLPGTWHFKNDGLWIGFDSKSIRLRSGRRSSSRRLVSLSVCLKHDPGDSRFRSKTSM